MSTTRNYVIGNRAANHRKKIDGNWRSFRYGDEIPVTDEQFKSGRLSHLQLTPVLGTQTTDDTTVHVPASVVEPISGTGTGQGGNGSSTQPVTDGTGGTGGATTEDDEVSDEKIKALLEEVKASKVDDGTFAAAREKVIALDLFEADTLPDTKKGVIEALESLIEE